MSLPRSIDRSDLGAGSVILPTTTETVVLVGPNLQTPKDTSFIVFLATITLTLGTAATGVVLRVRQGSTVAGTQIGQSYVQQGVTAGQSWTETIMVSAAVNFTDYVQWCLTAQQQAATANATVSAATALAISF
jgi:hypothetical protein